MKLETVRRIIFVVSNEQVAMQSEMCHISAWRWAHETSAWTRIQEETQLNPG